MRTVPAARAAPPPARSHTPVTPTAYPGSVPRRILVDAVGARIAIALDTVDDEAEAAIRRAWADAVIADDGTAPDGTAPDGPAPDATVTPGDKQLDRMMETLSQQVTMAALTHSEGKAWMLHAAGLADDSGAVVVLVGPSGRGKTTASRTLAQHWGYVSDETIRIDADGTVHAYRKPLSVIEKRGTPKVQVAPSEAGLRPLPEAPLRVQAIVILDRDAAHPGPPQLEQADLGDAIEELVLQSSFLTSADGPLRFIQAVAEASGGVRRVHYSEAADLPAVIATLFDEPAVVIPPLATSAEAPEAPEKAGGLTAADPAPGDDSEASGAGGRHPESHETAPRFRRAPHADSCQLDDPERTLVLSVDTQGQGTVRMMAGIGPVLWNAATGLTLQELTDIAVAAHGAPEGHDPQVAVMVALGELMDAGLLVSDETALARRGDVAWVDRGDRIVTLPLADLSALPRELDETGSVIWDWLGVPVTLTQLRARATAEVGATDASVADDVEAFITDLVDAQLVGAVDAQPAPYRRA